MPNKSFSIYSAEEYEAEEGEQLVLEIANSHLACIVFDERKRSIVACEVFSFNPEEGQNINVLFTRAIALSKILSVPPASVKIYINNEYCIPVPIFQFKRELASEYLDLVFGEDANGKVKFEHLPVEPGIINVYRIREELLTDLQDRFENATFHHTYSNIIRTRLNQFDQTITEQVSVQFYNTFFIITVLKGAKLHLLQTFVYETPEDVLYFLLNICQQLGVDNDSVTIQISGMIDVHFKLYRELITYFKSVKVQSSENIRMAPDPGEYPMHYFTPYFNLAL